MYYFEDFIVTLHVVKKVLTDKKERNTIINN